MKVRLSIGLAAALLATALFGAPVAARQPTCADVLGAANHGEHVLGLYVVGGSLVLGHWPPSGGIGQEIGGRGAALPGGPGPEFHFKEGFAPGASFCNSQSQSPGFHVP